MNIRKKIVSALLSLIAVFGILSLSSCQSDENTSVNSISECISTIEKEQKNANIHNTDLKAQYCAGIENIESYVQSLSNKQLSDEELANELSICIQDVIKYTEYFEKLNIELDRLSKDLISCNNYYEPKLESIENEFNVAYEKYPNYYTGTEAQYKSERTTWQNKILSANRSYDLAMSNIKAASEATGLPESVLSRQYYNKYLADVPYYESQLKALDTAWSQTQILNEIAERYTSMYNTYSNARQEILDEAESVSNFYGTLIVSIEQKYDN